MTITLRTITTTLGLAAFAAAFAPLANAGCGGASKPAAASNRQPGLYMVQAAYRPAWLASVADKADDDPIVGMWKVHLQTGAGVFDWGLSQWHSDGTEILNSALREPATENFCLGVWKKTGHNTYQLNHIALSYGSSPPPGDALVNIREYVTLDHTGNSYQGTFTVDIFPRMEDFVLLPADPGLVHAHAITGTITATRLTAD